MDQTAVHTVGDEVGLQFQVLVLHVSIAIEIHTVLAVVEDEGIVGLEIDGCLEGTLALLGGINLDGIQSCMTAPSKKNGIFADNNIAGCVHWQDRISA